MAVHIHPVKIPPRYYKPIGEIVAGWNLTEALVSSIIWHIHHIRSPKVGRLFTYRPAAVEKLKILEVTLKNYVKPKIRNQLTPLLSRAAGLRAKRNMIAHGLWGRMPNVHTEWKVFYHRDTGDTFQLRRTPLTIPEVAKIAADIDRLNRDLKKWMAQNRVPPP